MKYCNKCGQQISEGQKFCTGCGNKITATKTTKKEEEKKPPIKVEEKKTTDVKTTENDEATKLGVISLALYFVLPIIGYIFNWFIYLFAALFPPLMVLYFVGLIAYLGKPAGIVTMVIMRIKYPENTFGKVLMWVYIGLTILGVVFTILILLFVFALIFYIAYLSEVYY